MVLLSKPQLPNFFIMMSQNLTSTHNSSVPPPPQLTPTIVNSQLPQLTQSNIPLPPLSTIAPQMPDLQQQSTGGNSTTKQQPNNNATNNKLQSNNGQNYPTLDQYITMEIEEEPKYQAVNGIVQPPCVPNESKRHRNTNQLQFILKNVIKAVLKHQFAWPFAHPVDTIKLRLPDYHNLIIHPMDINTIKKRIENCYYWSAQEALHDFKTMFNNCYVYNKPGEDVVFMGQTLEKLLRQKLMDMPPVEEEISMPPIKSTGKNKRGKKGGFNRTSSISSATATTPQNNLTNLNETVSPIQTNLQSPLPSLFNQQQPTAATNTTSTASATNNLSNLNGLLGETSLSANLNGFNPKSPITTNNQNTTLTNSHSTRLSVHSPKESKNLLTPNLQSHSQTTQRSSTHSFIDNQSSNLVTPKLSKEIKQEQNQLLVNNSSSKSSKKGVKRKVADTTTSFDYPQFEPQPTSSKKMSTRRESGRPIKKPVKDLPYTAPQQSTSKTKKGKLSEQLKYCSLILKELFSKKHNSYAWPFLQPVVSVIT